MGFYTEKDEEIERLRERIKLLTNPYQLGYKEGDAHGRKDAEAKLAEEQAHARQQERLRAKAEAEVERLRDEVARLANLNISIGDSEAKARAEVERLRAKTVNISVIHPPIDERVRELNERVTDLYADVTEWHDTAERNKRRAEKVLEKHSSGWDNSHHQYCQECEKDWPCPTVRILNGEE